MWSIYFMDDGVMARPVIAKSVEIGDFGCMGVEYEYLASYIYFFDFENVSSTNF
jgi:hypothetical protein